MIQNAQGKYALFKLHCMDLLVLEEMEYSGIVFDTKKATQYADELETELEGIYSEMVSLVGNVPFNLNSNDHVSAILYGGDIVIVDRIPVGVYKTGAKEGQPRYSLLDRVYTLPRLVTPLKGTETKVKDGEEPKYWKVNNDILRSVKLNKEAKRIVELLNRYGLIEKLCGTYLRGWTKLIDTMHWPTNMIHGTLNQTTVITGRLSSTKPNLQNADPRTKTYCVSRY